jgi:acyl-CoA thioester hydrolase
VNDTAVTLRVRPNDLDVLRHVNNATALEYLETGRWHWLEANGLRPDGTISAVVARLEIDYRRPIGLGEVTVHTRLLSAVDADEPSYQAVFAQSVAQAGATAVEARVQVAFVERDTGLLATLQEYLDSETR